MLSADDDMVEIQAAIDEWERETCLRFETATDSDVNYVLFQNGDG